jgi:predicted hotdog family 3-hydroxylacyl-ACP dehydratase
MLARAGIEALIPHRGPMCLLERTVSWSEKHIECVAVNHRDPAHPLRTRSGLMASAAIEYAAQAAALHGALAAQAAGAPAPPGYLASARDVRLGAWRIDDLHARQRPDELSVAAELLAGDSARLLYTFRVALAGAEIASGRLAVILNPGLPKVSHESR